MVGDLKRFVLFIAVAAFKIIAGLAGLLIGLFGFVYVWDTLARFENWRTLDAQTVLAAAQSYPERRRIDDVAVCIYAVSCESGRARLEPVNIEHADFDALRDRIWGRRFRAECPGHTANLGLHLVPLEGREDDITAQRSVPYWSSTAYWSFSGNVFLPRMARWSSGAFSEGPWRPCTPEHYAFIRRNGIVTEVTQDEPAQVPNE